MTDIESGRSLADFVSIDDCGGFSYGGLLGAGHGCAKSILLHKGNFRSEFQKSFESKDTFTLGVCNGCQMLSRIAGLIPGTDHWPEFVDNESQRIRNPRLHGPDPRHQHYKPVCLSPRHELQFAPHSSQPQGRQSCVENPGHERSTYDSYQTYRQLLQSHNEVSC